MVVPARREYVAVASFGDGWWSTEVPQLPGVVSHSSIRADVESSVRDAIAQHLGIDPGSFSVRTIFVDPSASADAI
jgi:predicted RNase H-like HicB family nuclease